MKLQGTAWGASTSTGEMARLHFDVKGDNDVKPDYEVFIQLEDATVDALVGRKIEITGDLTGDLVDTSLGKQLPGFFATSFEILDNQL